MLAEIQQTSDVTYRIYDFNRVDHNGNTRQLHTEEAAECIDYNVEKNYRTLYKKKRNAETPLVECKYFNTMLYDIDKTISIDYSHLDSFVILICVSGEGTITDSDGKSTKFAKGQSLLIPAQMTSIVASGNMRFLETYIGRE